jgi:hypothetical protein
MPKMKTMMKVRKKEVMNGTLKAKDLKILSEKTERKLNVKVVQD